MTKHYSRTQSKAILLFIVVVMSFASLIPSVSTQQVQDSIWIRLESDYPDAVFYDISFMNHTHGWIVGRENSTYASDGIILFTNNSGNSWYTQLKQSSQRFTDINIVNENTIWTNGRGSLFYSANSGFYWNESVVLGGSEGMSTVEFVNETHGWTAHAGIMYKTTDSGLSWNIVNGWNFDDTPQMIQIVSSNCFWAMGFNGIYNSEDGGESWTKSSDIGGWTISFVSETVGWAIGDNRLAHTNDGSTWIEETVPMRAPSYRLQAPYTTDIFFLDVDTGWIVGTEILVMHTPDGGVTWHEQSTPELSVRIYSISIINQTHGFASGSEGTILTTQSADALGPRLWKGLTDTLFLTIISVISLAILVPIGGVILIRRKKRKSKSMDIQ